MPERLPAIDMVRGVIMALMALDHTRDFFFGFTPSPTDLSQTWPALFATRWITHICAPGFLFLADASAWLCGRGRPRQELSRYLFLRGALLVTLELTVVSFAWIPDPGSGLILLQVIWAIGWSMILMSALVRLPRTIVGGLGGAGMLLFPLIAPNVFAELRLPGWSYIILIQGGLNLVVGEGVTLIVSYSILPWRAVMAFGFGIGPLFAMTKQRWRNTLLVLGMAFLAAFALLRGAGIGDPEPWQRGQDFAASAMSFLNCEKYPPSPAFLLMTLGPVLLLLSALANAPQVGSFSWLRDIGRAPLLFYLLHL